MLLEFKNWLVSFLPWATAIGVAITFGLFWIRLRADTRFARIRETVAFIEKREKEMRDSWASLKAHADEGTDADEKMRVFVGQLELVSHLIQCGGFDSEIVYTYWWMYFHIPVAHPTMNSWIQLSREDDKSVYEHYVKQCKTWAKRLDRETGRHAKQPVAQEANA